MTLKNMLKAVEDFLSAKERKRLRQRDAIKKVLRALKKKERALAAKAASSTSSSKARALEHKRRVARAQRRKGVAALRALRRER